MQTINEQNIDGRINTMPKARESKIMELKRWLTESVKSGTTLPKPLTQTYQNSLGDPLYTITIHTTELDHFIDKNGVKWTREKEKKSV